MTDIDWMRLAYEQAQKAEASGEVPIGAVLVDVAGELISTGFNQVIQTPDPSAHAEIVALREAAKKMGNYRLPGTTLYVTLEPCSMCAGALVHARIQRVVFATRDPKAGAAGSVCHLLDGYPFNHRVMIEEGILWEECASLLRDFFKKKR